VRLLWCHMFFPTFKLVKVEVKLKTADLLLFPISTTTTSFLIEYHETLQDGEWVGCLSASTIAGTSGKCKQSFPEDMEA
jgi:hypothetical protein